MALELLREGRFGMPSARVIERLGAVNTERAVSMIALAAHDIPYVFSPAALKEAEEAKPATLSSREDWRSLPLVTIDPADAKDHDDAVHAAFDEDPGNPGGFVLTVAIADVAWYVRPGSALDKEALERGNSVYFPDRVVPMLPERISNDLCSLRSGEDRPALAARIVIGADGRKKTPCVSPHHDALGGEAFLRAGASRDRRPPDADDRAAARAGVEAAMGGLCGAEERARSARPARSRPAGTQAHPRQ